jgi:hypothetical protein
MELGFRQKYALFSPILVTLNCIESFCEIPSRKREEILSDGKPDASHGRVQRYQVLSRIFMKANGNGPAVSQALVYWLSRAE